MGSEKKRRAASSLNAPSSPRNATRNGAPVLLTSRPPTPTDSACRSWTGARSLQAAQRARAGLEGGCDLVDQLTRPVEGQPLGAELTAQAAYLPRRLLHLPRGLARLPRGWLSNTWTVSRRPRAWGTALRV